MASAKIDSSSAIGVSGLFPVLSSRTSLERSTIWRWAKVLYTEGTPTVESSWCIRLCFCSVEVQHRHHPYRLLIHMEFVLLLCSAASCLALPILYAFSSSCKSSLVPQMFACQLDYKIWSVVSSLWCHRMLPTAHGVGTWCRHIRICQEDCVSSFTDSWQLLSSAICPDLPFRPNSQSSCLKRMKDTLDMFETLPEEPEEIKENTPYYVAIQLL